MVTFTNDENLQLIKIAIDQNCKWPKLEKGKIQMAKSGFQMEPENPNGKMKN